MYFRYILAIANLPRRPPWVGGGAICMRHAAHIVLQRAPTKPKYWREKPEKKL